MNIEENMHDEYFIISIKVIKDIERKRNRVSSFMIDNPQAKTTAPKAAGKVNFFYDLEVSNPDMLCLYGVNSESFHYTSSLKKPKSLGNL